MSQATSLELIKALRQLLGDAHVLTPDQTDLSSYEQDWRKRIRGKALAVVRPANTQQVADVIKACGRAQVSVVPQGGSADRAYS
jgi:FAD/FMN-containing dehydrogenase